MLVLSFPSIDGAITSPSEASTPRSAMTSSSRPMMTATIHVEARPTSSRAISTPETSSLSAVVSRKEPSLLVTPHRRARRPSTQSVAAARQKSAAAINSVDDSSSPFSTSHMTTGVRRIRVALPAAIKPAERMLLRITIGFATKRADSTARCPRRCRPGRVGGAPGGRRPRRPPCRSRAARP